MKYTKTIAACIESIQPVKVNGDIQTEISSIEYDSRKVKKSSAFFALPGIHTNGKQFINAAIKNGASAVFYESDWSEFKNGVCYIQVENIRRAMSKVSAVFFENPSADLGIIGVTGTEGKSSTVSFIFQLLNYCGEKAGFFSTVEYSTDGDVIPNPEHQTTPESNVVQERLALMRNAGCKYAVVEASSHGLSSKTSRLADVLFDAGVFMNVTQEHLEFHGTLEQYRFDKAALFRSLNIIRPQKKIGKIPIFGIVNYDDPFADYFINATKQPVYLFSTDKNNLNAVKKRVGLFAKNISEHSGGIDFTILEFQNGNETEYSASLKLVGLFNVKNILAAVITVNKITGIPLKNILTHLPKIKPVKGRMSRIDEGQNFEVIIDYAHTPSSFMTIFPALQQRIKQSGGKLICVFGSGGERDLQKRPEQGRIASEYADIIILADEDPRGEDPEELLEMIAAGIKNKKRNEELFIIPDRYYAIKKACSIAKKNDAVLLLGKGHENSIIYKDKTIPYDEEKTVRRILKAM